MPEMLIPLTPNRLVVFRHDLLTYPYRPAGESLVLQTWLMSEPFAPDPLDERIVSLPSEIQGERLHVISLMTHLLENSFGPLALLGVYAAGTDTVTRVPVERFDIDLYYMAGKLEALGMGLSYTCYGALSTENEVNHFDNVFFKIGEDEARLMFFHWYFRYCYRTQYLIGAFLIVWFSSELDWRVLRVTANFSSSELSSHQIPRCLRVHYS